MRLRICFCSCIKYINRLCRTNSIHYLILVKWIFDIMLNNNHLLHTVYSEHNTYIYLSPCYTYISKCVNCIWWYDGRFFFAVDSLKVPLLFGIISIECTSKKTHEPGPHKLIFSQNISDICSKWSHSSCNSDFLNSKVSMNHMWLIQRMITNDSLTNTLFL